MVWFLIHSSLVCNMQVKWLGLLKYPTTSCSTETQHPICLYSCYVDRLHILFQFTLHEACDHIQHYLYANLDSTNDNFISYDSLILGLQCASEMAGPPQVPQQLLAVQRLDTPFVCTPAMLIICTFYSDSLHEACNHIQCYLSTNLDSTNDNIISYDNK